jgi:protein gp37
MLTGSSSAASRDRTRGRWIEWAAKLRDECAEAGVAFFLKQLGGFPNKRGHDEARLDGRRYVEMPAAPVPSEGPADAR